MRPVIHGNVALLPRTFKCRLDLSSPPSITWHFTVSFVLDFTASDIIPPEIRQPVRIAVSGHKAML